MLYILLFPPSFTANNLTPSSVIKHMALEKKGLSLIESGFTYFWKENRKVSNRQHVRDA